MSRWKRYATLGSILLVGCLAGAWFLKPIGVGFDRAVWQDQSKVQSGSRLGMADRLVARGTLVGMTREAVVEMLGPPEERSSDRCIAYGLGPERGLMSVDTEVLLVELDEQGRVAACRIIHT